MEKDLRMELGPAGKRSAVDEQCLPQDMHVPSYPFLGLMISGSLLALTAELPGMDGAQVDHHSPS